MYTVIKGEPMYTVIKGEPVYTVIKGEHIVTYCNVTGLFLVFYTL